MARRVLPAPLFAEECLVRPGCLSFNYRRAAIFCELNYENDSSTDTDLKNEDGWIFGRRESWPMVGCNSIISYDHEIFVKIIEEIKSRRIIQSK